MWITIGKDILTDVLCFRYDIHQVFVVVYFPWWRHQMETFSALLAICAGNSPVSGEFPAQRPVTRSFDVFFDERLIKRLSKHSRGLWFETLSHPLWRHRNVYSFPIKVWFSVFFCSKYHILFFTSFATIKVFGQWINRPFNCFCNPCTLSEIKMRSSAQSKWTIIISSIQTPTLLFR